jgi:hypothetical protein
MPDALLIGPIEDQIAKYENNGTNMRWLNMATRLHQLHATSSCCAFALTCIFCGADFGPTMVTIEEFVLWYFFRDHSMDIIPRNIHNAIGATFGRLRNQQIEFVVLMDMQAKIKTKFIHYRGQTIEHYI